MPLSKSATRECNTRINDAGRVVVVAAGSALDEYKRCSAYICLPNRTFQSCVRMAFYTKNRVYHKIPKIIGRPIEAISAQEIETRTDLSEAQRERLRTLLKNVDAQRRKGWNEKQYKIFFSHLTTHPIPLHFRTTSRTTRRLEGGNVLPSHRANGMYHCPGWRKDRGRLRGLFKSSKGAISNIKGDMKSTANFRPNK